MSFKQQVYDQCSNILAAKLHACRQALQELADSAANETKSSAGDKYETARAMLHIEQDNIRRQLAEAMAQKAVLDAIDPGNHAARIGPGSLVKTNTGCYFLSIAAGKLSIDGAVVITLSLQSPLGSKLKGLQAGDRTSINGTEIIVENIS